MHCLGIALNVDGLHAEIMVTRDIYKDEVDFAVLALQSPAFNKQYASNPALRQTRLISW